MKNKKEPAKKNAQPEIKPETKKEEDFVRLSSIQRPPQYCHCTRCELVFLNDLNTQHACCPNCNAWMTNISKKAALNLKSQYRGASK